jgi:hypothetical protein
MPQRALSESSGQEILQWLAFCKMVWRFARDCRERADNYCSGYCSEYLSRWGLMACAQTYRKPENRGNSKSFKQVQIHHGGLGNRCSIRLSYGRTFFAQEWEMRIKLLSHAV